MVESVVAVAGCDQGADEVVARSVLFRIDKVVQHPNDHVGSGLRVRVVGLGCGGGEQPVQLVTEAGTVWFGHTQELADDREREGKRELGDEINRRVRPLGGNLVKQVIDDGLDVRTHRLDSVRREGCRYEPPQPSVVGLVDVEHVPGERRAGQTFGHDVAADCERGTHVLREPLVIERGVRRLVMDDQPSLVAVHQRDPMHRPELPDLGEQGKRGVLVISTPRRKGVVERRHHRGR